MDFKFGRTKASPRSLACLPGDILGIIFTALDGEQNRQAFFSCCKTVRYAPQVLELIDKTTLDLTRISDAHSSLEPLCFFPRGAYLRRLSVKGNSCWYGEYALVKLSQQEGHCREKDLLAQVQELELDKTVHAPTHALLSLCPNLRNLMLPSCPMWLLQSLTDAIS
ncbi:hypothetical protein DUNSADRAFT_1011 [Dunaliella salina]|uniref:Uncharacterized protein n=1 Tax=Dunaliella salina TaxID=3046 RepID=A0ABQ7FY47_DUNSA|nr:hypothetical protein DUNSADRAFT_1011 [Dunaliella salina]|eukprot:KAF5827273.1 hypothetical protein DUNSADRAFT_1011 [Dunaliella salina]